MTLYPLRFQVIVAFVVVSAGLLAGCNDSTKPKTVVEPPEIKNFSAAQPSLTAGNSSTLSWQVSGSDPMTLSLDQGIGPVLGNSRVVTPTVTTTYTLTATNSAGQVLKSVTVTVNPASGQTPANQAPSVINPISSKNVTQGATAQGIDLKTVFGDAEDGSANLSFSVTSSDLAVASPSVSGSSLNLNFGNPGTAQVTVVAKDTGNLTVSTMFSVTVTSNGTPPVNQAPVVTNPISNKTVTQGASSPNMDLKTVFNDAEDGTNLNFTASSSNPSVVGVAVSGSVLSLTYGSVGTAQITLNAKDTGNLSISSTFGVTVNAVAVNQTPTVIGPISSKNVNTGAAGQSIDLQSVFNDTEDGTNLTFTASSTNAGVVSASVSGNVLSLAFGSAGTAQVTVSAKDSGNLSVSSTFTVTVNAVSVNQAPSVAIAVGNKSVTVGAVSQSINLSGVFYDAEDGTNLIWGASSSNTSVVSAAVSGSNALLTFGSTGTAQVTLSAKDTGNLSASTSFNVTVASNGGGGTTAACIGTNFMTVLPYAGNSSLPDPVLTVTCTSTKASIYTNAIPNHKTGTFPNSGNPNSISAQSRTYPLPLSPALAASSTSQSLGTMGLAINGVALEPMAAEFYNNDKTSGWQYEALATTPSAKKLGLDTSNAHVQPNGNYHYHGLPTALVTLIGKGTAMTLIGYIGDGFPIYAVYGHSSANDASSATKELKSSYQLKTGTRASGPGGSYDGTFVQDYEYVQGLGDLDACNGRYGVTPEYPNGIYHYYMTNNWPFIPRCFSGTPESFYTATPK